MFGYWRVIPLIGCVARLIASRENCAGMTFRRCLSALLKSNRTDGVFTSDSEMLWAG